jgi:hypothetical protein
MAHNKSFQLTVAFVPLVAWLRPQQARQFFAIAQAAAGS